MRWLAGTQKKSKEGKGEKVRKGSRYSIIGRTAAGIPNWLILRSMRFKGNFTGIWESRKK
jgi:hypothetical protein